MVKKVPTLFKRDSENMSRVLNEVDPRCQWVIDGEGEAYRKLDGTAMMIDLYPPPGGKIVWKRRTVRRGKKDPTDFRFCEEDPNTGKRFGWVPVTQHDEDQYHADVWRDEGGGDIEGTCELIGPKVQGDAEPDLSGGKHVLISHRDERLKFDEEVPRDFDGLRDFLRVWDIEGIVWHHPDGRMAKIKGRDFDHVRGEGYAR